MAGRGWYCSWISGCSGVVEVVWDGNVDAACLGSVFSSGCVEVKEFTVA